MSIRLETIAERRVRLMAEHERRTAGERRKAFWAGKAFDAGAERREVDRREADRLRAADSRAVSDWLARFEAAKARLALA